MRANKSRILLVDDEPSSVDLIKKYVENQGFNTKSVDSGDAARSAIKTFKPDLIFLDLVMPGESGIEVLKDIRSRYHALTLPIIMLTAVTESEDIVTALKYGANDYITKPVRLPIAIARIQTQLECRRLHSEQIVKKQIASLSNLIVTYGHELINPLTIVRSILEGDIEELTNDQLEAARQNTNRMIATVQRIKNLTTRDVVTREYANGIEMISL